MDDLHAEGARLMAVAMGSPSRQIAAVTMGSPPLAWQPPPPLASAPAYAGFWRRFLAGLIDWVLIGFAFYQLNLLWAFILMDEIEEGDSADGTWIGLAVWLTVLLTVCMVVNWFYFAVMESSPWQATLGKRALGMVVTDLAGSRISFGRATGRLFASFVSGVPLWLGYFIQPFTAKRQALHDMISGTLVLVRS